MHHRVLADIEAAVAFTATQPDVRANAVGITGFCMGGQYAFMAGCTVERLAACVSWYGMLRYAATNDMVETFGDDLPAWRYYPVALRGQYGDAKAGDLGGTRYGSD